MLYPPNPRLTAGARVFAGWVKQVFDTGFARIRAIRGRPTKLLNQ
jgi:hypothetical protein